MTIEVAKLAILKDKGGIPTYARRLTQTHNILMAASTDYSLSVPADASVAILNASNEFFVSDSAITLPTGTFAASKAVLAPTGIIVNASLGGTIPAITTLYFKTTVPDTVLSVCFYTACSVLED